MKYLLLLASLLSSTASFAQVDDPAKPVLPPGPPTDLVMPPPKPAYGIAKTIDVPFTKGKRALILDDGIKRKLRSAYLEDEKGKPLRFDSESAVLNYLAAAGWEVTPNGQEQTPNGTFTVYQLKRRPAPAD